jgi:predicted glycoside hydrolase/deacetylase ChbG (UPF0249 family)
LAPKSNPRPKAKRPNRIPGQHGNRRPQTRGRSIVSGAEKLHVRGVTYGPFGERGGSEDAAAVSARELEFARHLVDGARTLIVNADDLGLAAGVNAGIAEAHQRGIVTSASVMVRRAAVEEVARLSAEHPALALGLHIDVGQWHDEREEGKQAYAHCPPGEEEAVASECASQLEAFRALLGRDPTHLDSHKHAHRTEPVASVAARMAKDLRVPLRGVGIRYEGGFYGQTDKGEPDADGISLEHLLALIRQLPPGWTELGCHPGIGVEETQSSYAGEREQELQVLCDFRVRSVLETEHVRQRSFAEVR